MIHKELVSAQSERKRPSPIQVVPSTVVKSLTVAMLLGKSRTIQHQIMRLEYLKCVF